MVSGTNERPHKIDKLLRSILPLLATFMFEAHEALLDHERSFSLLLAMPRDPPKLSNRLWSGHSPLRVHTRKKSASYQKMHLYATQMASSQWITVFLSIKKYFFLFTRHKKCCFTFLSLDFFSPLL